MMSSISSLDNRGRSPRCLSNGGSTLTLAWYCGGRSSNLRTVRSAARGYHFSGLVSRYIELHDLPQGAEDAVVEVGAPQRDIAQARRLEHAAILVAVGEVAAQRAAHPEIVEGRIGVRRYRRIARNAERGEAIIGELRRRAVVAARA